MFIIASTTEFVFYTINTVRKIYATYLIQNMFMFSSINFRLLNDSKPITKYYDKENTKISIANDYCLKFSISLKRMFHNRGLSSSSQIIE